MIAMMKPIAPSHSKSPASVPRLPEMSGSTLLFMFGLWPMKVIGNDGAPIRFPRAEPRNGLFSRNPDVAILWLSPWARTQLLGEIRRGHKFMGGSAGPQQVRRRFPWLELIWADGGYNAWQVDAAVAKVPLLRIEIIKRSDDTKGFVVLPRRWVVERTFSWFGRNRRLAGDFEDLAETFATFVTFAAIQLSLRRLDRK
jgi:transposase